MKPLPVALAGLAALAVAMGIGRFAFTPILPMMQADAGLSMAAGGWLASANYAGYLAGALSAVFIKLRPASIIRASLVLIGLSTLAMGLDERFALWLVLRAIAGVTSAWVLVFVSTWALGWLAALGRSGLGGIVYAGVGTGVAMAGIACLILMGLHASAAQAWLWLGVISFALTALVWPVFGGTAPSREAISAAAAPSAVAWNSRWWRMVLCYGAYGFGYIIPATFLPVMAKAIIPDPLVFGWAWPVFGAAAVASTLLAARIVHYRRVWIASHLVMAAGVLMPLLTSSPAGILASALLVGSTFVVITMAGMQEARIVAGPAARTLMAAMTSAFALGQIAGPLLVGALGGFNQALLASAGLLVLSAFALVENRNDRTQHRAHAGTAGREHQRGSA